MNFDLTEDQLMIQQMVRDFAEQEIRPNLNKWDEGEIFPIETMKKMGKKSEKMGEKSKKFNFSPNLFHFFYCFKIHLIQGINYDPPKNFKNGKQI